MAWTQRAPRFYVSARAAEERLRSAAAARSTTVLPATAVELVMVTQQYAPINSRGARKPGTSDERTVEVLKTVPLAEAITLVGALARAIADASAQVGEEAETFDLDGLREHFIAHGVDMAD